MRTYKRKNHWVNNSGYTDGSYTKLNNQNTIPTNQITMANTSEPIFGQGVDLSGYPTGPQIVMRPGQEYNFEGADAVVENPIFQLGGNIWYNNQPIEYWENLGATYRQNTFNNTQPIVNTGDMSRRPVVVDPNANPYQNINWNNTVAPAPIPEVVKPTVSETQIKAASVDQPQPTPITNQPATTAPQNNSIVTEDPNLNDWNRAYLTGKGTVPTDDPFTKNQEEVQNQTQETQRFQFDNPYTGMNLENSAQLFGNSIQSGNTAMAIGSGLKMLTGLGRNLLSGVGYANRNNQVYQSYMEQQRQALTQENRPQYLQDGGTVMPEMLEEVSQLLQQGSTPEEIFQLLLQNGISEQEAQTILEQASQSFKTGGVYRDILLNKKVKRYSLNEDTNEYEVEYE